MKKILLTIFFSCFLYFSFSQCDGRYDNEIFTNVNKNTVYYSDVFNDSEHEMDVYTPYGDTKNNRPLIIYMHGGTFLSGDKEDTDCIDFCETFTKRGFVCASINYRLVPIIQAGLFISSNSLQFSTVLKATMDAKAAVRFFRKDVSNGNTYGIDENTIFVGGYSAGAVSAIHLAYLDSITDLPTNPTNVQDMILNLGGIEGDAGNFGFSSKVSGIISFAGGIHDLNWIDALDEPIVSCQGELDLTVNFNCGPGINTQTVLELCGLNEIHPRANTVGLINEKLVFTNTAHSWPSAGNLNFNFQQAIEFTKDFLYPLLPCNNTTNNTEISISKELIKIVDITGKEVNSMSKNKVIFCIYSNGEVHKRIKIEK